LSLSSKHNIEDSLTVVSSAKLLTLNIRKLKVYRGIDTVVQGHKDECTLSIHHSSISDICFRGLNTFILQ